MLSRNTIIEALKKLGNELEKREFRGEIILTGGASMCLVHSARDITKDVDALEFAQFGALKVTTVTAEYLLAKDHGVRLSGSFCTRKWGCGKWKQGHRARL